jgi:hypothetical protein
MFVSFTKETEDFKFGYILNREGPIFTVILGQYLHIHPLVGCPAFQFPHDDVITVNLI